MWHSPLSCPLPGPCWASSARDSLCRLSLLLSSKSPPLFGPQNQRLGPTSAGRRTRCSGRAPEGGAWPRARVAARGRRCLGTARFLESAPGERGLNELTEALRGLRGKWGVTRWLLGRGMERVGPRGGRLPRRHWERLWERTHTVSARGAALPRSA
jgi:hypothetical protein